MSSFCCGRLTSLALQIHQRNLLLVKVFSQIPTIVSHVASIGPHTATIVVDVAFITSQVPLVAMDVSRLPPCCCGVSTAQIPASFSPIVRYVALVAANVAPIASDVASVMSNVFSVVPNIANVVSYFRTVGYGHRNLRHHHRAHSQRCRRDPEHHLPGSFHIVSHLLSGLFRSREHEPYSPRKGFATLPRYTVTEVRAILVNTPNLARMTSETKLLPHLAASKSHSINIEKIFRRNFSAEISSVALPIQAFLKLEWGPLRAEVSLLRIFTPLFTRNLKPETRNCSLLQFPTLRWGHTNNADD
jgi:hypothetical protein